MVNFFLELIMFSGIYLAGYLNGKHFWLGLIAIAAAAICSRIRDERLKRYQGGSFCENKGCPAYQEIPAAEEGGEWEKRFVEKCAPAEHDRWAKWMSYLFEKSDKNKDGSVTIPANLVERWERQASSGYDFLSEKEKESDRIEVRKYLPAIRTLLSRTRKDATEEAWREAVGAVPRGSCFTTESGYGKCFCERDGNTACSARQALIEANAKYMEGK